MTRDLNPDRGDDGAQAEAEMKEREAPSYSEPVAWQNLEVLSSILTPEQYGMRLPMADGRFRPLYAALPAPQGDDTLVGRLGSNIEHYQRGLLSLDDIEKDEIEAVAALRAQAAEIARLKAERDEYRGAAIEFRARFVTSFGAEAVSAHEKLKAAEARLASAMEALEPFAKSKRGLEITINELTRARTTLSSIKRGEA